MVEGCTPISCAISFCEKPCFFKAEIWYLFESVNCVYICAFSFFWSIKDYTNYTQLTFKRLFQKIALVFRIGDLRKIEFLY